MHDYSWFRGLAGCVIAALAVPTGRADGFVASRRSGASMLTRALTPLGVAIRAAPPTRCRGIRSRSKIGADDREHFVRSDIRRRSVWPAYREEDMKRQSRARG